MSDSRVETLVRRSQSLFEREAGRPLGGEVRAELEALVRDSAGGALGEQEPTFDEREVAILFTDLRGFTSFSESLPPATVVAMLNTYLARMSRVVVEHGGTIDKFMGDSVMALFGAPSSRDDDVRRAVLCAVDMQIAMLELNARQKAQGLPELFMGIGVSTGHVMAGRLGSEVHSEYTVIGDDVNLAARIEAFSLRGQILISASTYERCRDFVEVGEPTEVYLKGKAEPTVVNEVLGIPSLGKEIPRLEVRRSIRVKVHMPFTYQVVEGKVVGSDVREGTIVDLSYNGVLARVDQRLARHSDIKLGIDLSLVDHVATDVYAKVLKVSESEDGFFEIGMEFTSVSTKSKVGIQRFVQLLIQGSASA